MSDDDLNTFLDGLLKKSSASELDRLLEYEILTSQSSGNSPKTTELTVLVINKLRAFLISGGRPTDARSIQAGDIRAFILHLQNLKRFSGHPFAKEQEGKLSKITINTYMRTLRAAFNRWELEGFIDESPFRKVRIPKAPKKVIPIFSQSQIEALLSVIDTSTPEGFRNRLLILLYLDTACRLTELTNLEMADIDLKERCLKLFGKGQKERYVPLGVTTQKLLWKYINKYRPEPAVPRFHNVFLARDGRPLTGKRVEAIFKKYGKKAGITGVRCSPHTLRHTACVMWLRNGGDIFSLQLITGHSSLEVLRGYVNLAQGDIAAAHQRYSAVDNLELRTTRKRPGAR